ncbi:FkbM family methyltransferase [Algiphilus sp.]|uniref:FkbM family methyltransferase n=1 Tax=Algiphilus sp. TaxID=1872431 RepID=UPI003B5178E1
MNLVKPCRVLRHYLDHPIGRRDRIGTLLRMLRWQAGSRLLAAEVAMPFVDGTRLLMRKGMTGATGNAYVGLMEFEDMAFVLHMLREGDDFLDVGANVGVYSILAASRGAGVLAVEPVPDTYRRLLDNVHLNGFAKRIDACNIGVGSKPGNMRFSTTGGPTNHVLVTWEPETQAIEVAVDSLDSIAAAKSPAMIKIDVEGFEANVIQGAYGILGQSSLQAVLIELNGLGVRYGFSDDDTHAQLLEAGFRPMRYDPFARRLVALDWRQDTGNTLYVRPSATLEQRLREAPAAWVFGVAV